MTETQATVSQWAEETFGPAGSNYRVTGRICEEVAELASAASANDGAKCVGEAADVVIVAYRLGARMGIDLDALFEAKQQRGDPKKLTARAGIALYRVLLKFRNGDDLGIWSKAIVKVSLKTVVRAMQGVCAYYGADLRLAISTKMAINRERKWRMDGTGHGYHVSRDPDDINDAHRYS